LALDEAHHHPALVGGREIDRAALDGVAGGEWLGALHVDQLRAAGKVRVVEHLLRRHFHRLALGNVAVRVGEGELHRLDLDVLRVRAVHREARHVEFLDDAKRDERGDALSVRRDLVQAETTVVAADRLDPFGLEAGEVACLHRAAMGGREAFDRLRDLAPVEGLALRFSDEPQCARSRLEVEQLAHLGRPAPGQEAFGKSRLLAQLGRRRGPLLLHDDRHQVPALGDVDRRLEQVGERQLPDALGQRLPAGDRARHR
jgi:hypothetical protein